MFGWRTTERTRRFRWAGAIAKSLCGDLVAISRRAATSSVLLWSACLLVLAGCGGGGGAAPAPSNKPEKRIQWRGEDSEYRGETIRSEDGKLFNRSLKEDQ